VRVKCLAQEQNTMPPARVRTRTARSGVERTNHEVTVPSLLCENETIDILKPSKVLASLNTKFNSAVKL